MVYVYSNTKDKRLVKVGSRTVGTLKDNRFIKQVIGSKHKLRYPSAWAIDAEAFDKEVRPNATEIIVIDKETGLKYHCQVKTFDRLKGELNRGFGRQYFLTLNHWLIEGNGHRQLSFWGSDGDAQ